MSRKAKIIIFSCVLIASYFIKWGDDYMKNSRSINKTTPENEKRKTELLDKIVEQMKKEDEIVYHPRPVNGFSPYDSFFGKGIYNNNSRNSFKIKNTNSSDAVVLLINAYSDRKVRNEYIRKGETFEMTGVPDGTYFLRWISGNDWSPNKIVGSLKGGFQTNQAFSETESSQDWMTANGGVQWTVTLYTVAGGDVEVENIDENKFSN
tara:strand:- start:2580 stop:3200 length:621 start_codon:yes stop_codon:yes gene_type:complete